MIKKLTSKKAVSPILAALLLIVVAVAAAAITYAWVTAFTTTQTTTASKAIKYDSAVINTTSDMATVYVRNEGTETVSLDRVYIDRYDHTTSVSTPSDFAASGATLSVDAVVEIELNGTAAGLDFSAGSIYKVKVAGPGVEWEKGVEAS
ncbi:type IV pilin [Candidatus Bathyarchaeota archaeon]|nr:type IV pilin [Candidatus Bathyarchaeota archaeon]